MVLTFESLNKILWCDHSNETSLAVLLCGTIFYNILENEILCYLLAFPIHRLAHRSL